MKVKWIIVLVVVVSTVGIVFALEGMNDPAVDERENSEYENWGDYWYRGEAELTSYDLVQSRYGEERKGEAVLIFVTEDFSKDKQVKLDRPSTTDESDKVKVLKMNHARKFITGIYPYSLMTSAFTPVDPSIDGKTIKVTTSTQEWCGHTFTQLNRAEKGYQLQAYSYFESEGDREEKLDRGIPEDGLWNQIRIDPDHIEEGESNLIPSLMYCRLRHIPARPYRADIKKSTEGKTTTLRVSYATIDRILEIRYNSSFPFEIIEWEERYKSGFGENASIMVTKANKKERLMLDYWNYNSSSDEPWRQKLGLTKN